VPAFLKGLWEAGASAVRADAYETALGHDTAGEELIRELRRDPPEDVAIALSSIAEVCALTRVRLVLRDDSSSSPSTNLHRASLARVEAAKKQFPSAF
jgi:hypothetical protein